MSLLNGLSIDELGDTTLVCLKQVKDGSWGIRSKSTFANRGLIQDIVNAGKEYVIGVPSNWKPSSLPDYTRVQRTISDDHFVAVIQNTQLKLLSDKFKNNLVATVPDDLFLCTIPVIVGKLSQRSFLSVHCDQKHTKIGVIIDQQLKVVFTLAGTETSKLISLIGRIQRYLRLEYPSLPCPSEIIFFGKTEFDLSGWNVTELDLGSYSQLNSSEIKAAGVALLRVLPESVTYFQKETPESKFTKYRKAALLGSIFTVSTGILLCLIVLGMQLISDYRLSRCKSNYSDLIENNQSIRQLIVVGDSLASKIIYFKKNVILQTPWTKFMMLLGTERPEGVFYDKLGSEPANNQENMIRIALTGWAKSETIIPEVIKQLEMQTFIKEISLNSLESDKKHPEISRFKIVCLLDLSN